MMEISAANCRSPAMPGIWMPAERLAATIDELRRNKGWSVVLRGHDFRLRESPRDPVKARPLPKIVLQLSRKTPAPNVPFIPLRVRSYYSFLDSTLSPAAIVGLARQHGLSAVAMTDLGNLHGAVEFAQAARKAGLKPIFGAELSVDSTPVLLYVENATGYRNLNECSRNRPRTPWTPAPWPPASAGTSPADSWPNTPRASSP